MTSLYKQARKKQQRNAYTSIQPSPRDCSLAKPLSGGVFDPNGVLTKEKTLGFNYPPLKFSNLTNAGNMLMAKSNGFNQTNQYYESGQGKQKFATSYKNNREEDNDMESKSEASSISK